MKFGDISKKAILCFYLLLSVSGLAALFWGQFDQPWMLFLSSVTLLLVFSACLISGVLGTALIALVSISTLFLPQFTQVLILIAVYAGAAAVCCKFLITGSEKMEIYLSDKLLLLFSLMICISAGFSAWRYSTLEPLAGAGYLNIQVSVWGETTEAVLGGILLSTLAFCLAGPLLLLTKSVNTNSVLVRLLRRGVVLLLIFIIAAGIGSASLLTTEGTAPVIMQRVADWPTVDSLALSYPLSGVGIGTYLANASNNSVEIARPGVPHGSGPSVIGRLAAEAGFPASFIFLLAVVLLIFRQAAPAANTVSVDKKEKGLLKPALFTVALVAVLFGPFDFEMITLTLFMLALGLNTPAKSNVGEGASGAVAIGVAWVAVVMMLAMCLISNAQLAPMAQWERLRWPIDSGFYPAETEGGFRWTEPKAVKTLTPDRRFIYIEWLAGDSAVEDYSTKVRFSWDGRLVEELRAASGELQHTIVPVDPQGSIPRLLLIETDTPFVPSDHLANGDSRRLGIAIFKLDLIDELPAESTGFWSWESDGKKEFRWSRKISFLQFPIRKPFRIALRAGHPDIDEKPVQIMFSINGLFLRELTLNHRRWHEVTIDPADLPPDSLPLWHKSLMPDATGILRMEVDRAWTPSEYGDNGDNRTLGVAVGKVMEVGSPR
ncbi:MAG TPA: hypothetical protein VMX35_15650 [Acidobacteriota bacterium]|nr:hypothetical protein [Acidobacteriota bacterium]